jgi:hypothetical protein
MLRVPGSLVRGKKQLNVKLSGMAGSAVLTFKFFKKTVLTGTNNVRVDPNPATRRFALRSSGGVANSERRQVLCWSVLRSSPQSPAFEAGLPNRANRHSIPINRQIR